MVVDLFSKQVIGWRMVGLPDRNDSSNGNLSEAKEALREDDANTMKTLSSPIRLASPYLSIMRLAPVVPFYYPDRKTAVHYAGESSRTTHGAQEAIDSCCIFAEALCIAIDGGSKAEILDLEAPANASKRLSEIASGGYRNRPEAQIKGSGYVVDCLEAALWSFKRADNFGEAVLLAAHLGDDADTTAAVVGQIAGAYYGLSGIPDSWIRRLAMSEVLMSHSDALLRHNA